MATRLRQAGVATVGTWKRMMSNAEEQPLLDDITDQEDSRVFTLEGVTPSHADHSFNGIMFDIHAKGPENVDVLGFNIAGSLGATRIYSCNGSWWDTCDKDGDPQAEAWTEIFSSRCIKGSKHDPPFIQLGKPLPIPARNCVGIYIHCPVHHDKAIVYKACYSFTTIVNEDKNIALCVGQARCGSQPFDPHLGWWRRHRAMTGSVTYRSHRLVWNTNSHKHFPRSFQRVVIMLLMAWRREGCILSLLPRETLFEIFQHMEWDWFEKTRRLLGRSDDSEPGSCWDFLKNIFRS